jgi:hypothetical protein
MKLPLVRSIHTSNPMALLLLILLLIIPLPSHAIPYVYTYTGNPFTEGMGPDFPSSYSNITVTFSYDGDLHVLQDYTSQIPFTMNDGVRELHSWDSGVQCVFEFYSFDSQGLPTAWLLTIASQDSNTLTVLDQLYTANALPWWANGEACDRSNHHFTENDLDEYAINRFTPGIWVRTESNAPVPEPATLILLGSGLFGFAGFRKKLKK